MRRAWRRRTSWWRRAGRPERRRLIVAALLALWLGGATPVAAQDEAKRVAYDALSAMLLGQREAFLRATLPTDGADALLPVSPPTGDARARIEAQLERVRFSSQLPPLFEGRPVEDESKPPAGTRVVYVTQFGSSLVPVPVVRTRDGWRVDPRYWVAERAQRDADLSADTPVMRIKRFLYHVMNDETEPLKALSYLPEAVEELTRHNNLAGADRGHVAMLCVEMGVAPARAGEVVRMPSGTRITAGSSPDEQVYVGMLGTIEVPFRVRKVGDAWRVVPEPYFEYLRSMGAI